MQRRPFSLSRLIPKRHFVGKKNLLWHRVSKELHIEIGSSIAALTSYQMLIRLFVNTFCTEIPVFSKDVRVQFEGGVIIAADTLGSYGSLAKITNLDRVIKVRMINLQ
jgi:hypothetical protein